MTSLPAQPVQPIEPTGITSPTLALPDIRNAFQPRPRTPDEVLEHRLELAEAVKKLVRRKPKLKAKIDGKKYPLAPVWTFLAACDGVTVMITSTEELLTDDRLEMGYMAIAHAIDATGRVIGGAEARCMCAEPFWQGKPSFQLCSNAETRAGSKVLSLVYKDVMVLAGFEPTPAEEMGAPEHPGGKQLKTPCSKADCSNMISEKRRNQTRKKHGKALCIDCEKKYLASLGEKMTEPLNDPAQVGAFIENAKRRKANGGQPIVDVLEDAEDIA